MSNDKKKKVCCPGCGRQHVGDFKDMLHAWQSVASVGGLPQTREVVVGDALKHILADREAQTPTVAALLKYAALAEFYYQILSTDINELSLTVEEHNMLESMLEDFWHRGLQFAETLEAARQATLTAPVPEGTTLEAVFAAEALARSTTEHLDEELEVPEELPVAEPTPGEPPMVTLARQLGIPVFVVRAPADDSSALDEVDELNAVLDTFNSARLVPGGEA